jgi:hypothetical protein
MSAELLFMSMLNFILFNFILLLLFYFFMDMKRYKLIFFFSYPCWWIGKKSEIIIKLEVVIKKGEKLLL